MKLNSLWYLTPIILAAVAVPTIGFMSRAPKPPCEVPETHGVIFGNNSDGTAHTLSCPDKSHTVKVQGISYENRMVYYECSCH